MGIQNTRAHLHRIMKAHNVKSFDSEESNNRYLKYLKEYKMRNLYFNTHEFLNVLKLKDSDTDFIIERFKQYIAKYPHDYSARAYYVSALVTIKQFEEAKKELEELETIVDIYYNHLCDFEIEDKIISNIAYSKLKLLIYGEKYKEAYNYLLDNLSKISSDQLYLEAIILFLKQKLGYSISRYGIDGDEYLIKQVSNYHHEYLLSYLDKHVTSDSKEDKEEKEDSLFNSNFPLEEIISIIKRDYPNGHSLYKGLFEDTYVYRYDQCGKIGKKNTDYFKVLTLHDSNRIINMMPCQEGRYLDYTDLNYLNPNYNSDKVPSGLDRFNKKYAKYLIK